MNHQHSDIEYCMQISYDFTQTNESKTIMVVNCSQCGAKDVKSDHFNRKGLCTKTKMKDCIYRYSFEMYP